MQSRSIAVLPFVNMSSSIENEYVADGMTEEIINALAGIDELTVTSRTSSFYFKNKKLPISQIGKELSVSTILEGSIRLAGNKMRITAQLIDVVDDAHFWSETFDRSIDHIFEVQDEISLLIAERLREHLGHFELDNRLVTSPDISVEIYKKFLEGRFYLMKLTLIDTERAITIFKEVIEAEPGFPLPYLGINQGYSFLGTMGQIPASDGFLKAKPYLDKAIELDKNNPECLLNLAWNSCWQHWDLKSTYIYLNQALAIRPADNIYLTIANTLAVEGKFDAAFTYIEKALELDPFAPVNHHFKGFLYYLLEQFDQAAPCFARSLELKPDLSFPLQYIGLGMVLSGQAEQALDFFQQVKREPRGDLIKLGGSTIAHAALRNMAEAEAGCQQLVQALQTEAGGSAMVFLIYYYTFIGAHDEAIHLIAEGTASRLPMMLLLKTEPLLKPLRSHPQFQLLMAQVFHQEVNQTVAPKKYKSPLIEPEVIAKNKRQLVSLMELKKPFLDPTLSLRSLADILDTSPNHLSQLLNEGFEQNFAGFVNGYRLDEFKLKVATPSFQHMTLLALAYESGFNSKTVFNTFFKKKTGMTPKAFWNQTHTQRGSDL